MVDLADQMHAGVLYVVATPIGNLSDASPRSIEVLRGAHLIACEDTRVTRTLLARHGIGAPLVALHQHNERATSKKLLDALLSGQSVALVSDAGTPAVSDPGAVLVDQAHQAGVRVSPVPGPSAGAAAYSAAGFESPQFFLAGFLPPAGSERRRALEALHLPWPFVLYEAPHRVLKTIDDLAGQFGPQRQIVLARELTKMFEEVVRLPLGEARAWIEAGKHRQQGEFVLVIAAGVRKAGTVVDPDSLLDSLLESLAPSEAAKLVARITGLPKNALYRKALERGK
jgi:16S rRNA (cytidine1402-2'-O)-methyltransferase